jgi:hypothetical protein
MDVIGLDCQFNDLPSLFGALRLNQRPTIKADSARKHSFAALGRPDKVIDNEADSVFVALILHDKTVHLLISMVIVYHSTTTNARFWLKPPRETRLTARLQHGGLRRV